MEWGAGMRARRGRERGGFQEVGCERRLVGRAGIDGVGDGSDWVLLGG